MSSYNYQPADIADFSGGMTDDYMNGPVNMQEVLENFYILNNRSVKTRPGTALDNSDYPQIPTGSQRIQALISYKNSDKLFALSGSKVFYRDPDSYSTLFGPAGGDAFATAGLDSHFSHTEWNGLLMVACETQDKPIKIYKDSGGTYRLRTAGLPLPTTFSGAGTAGAQAYQYALVYQYTYTVGDQTFIDQGPVQIIPVANVNAPDVNVINLSGIPVLTNGAGDNYDTGNIRKIIFRTISGGTEFYQLANIPNAQTTYADTTSDTTLQTGAPLYTNGGVPDNDPPPLAKFCHTVNGFTYYAGIKTRPNDVDQSQALDPDSVPGSFTDTLEDEVTGLSSVQDIPVVGCRKHIYRIDGTFDELGRGGMAHRRISDHAGCISHESFVQAEGGLFWWGVDGIYYTEGFRVMKVTDHLNKRYQTYVATLNGKERKIKGVFNPLTRMIHWTVSTTSKASGSEDCDAIWSVDLQWGVSQNMSCFIWKGGDSFLPVSLEVHNKALYRGDRFGYVLKFSEDVTTDPAIIPTEDPDTWTEDTIIWKLRSIASNFGTSFVRKVANRVLISSRNETNVSIQVTAINDDGKLTRPITPIRWRRNFTWGDEEFVWGDESFAWYYGGTIEVDRRFPAKGFRFNYLQLEITNAYINIINSDLYGEATFDATTKEITLVDPSAIWPMNAVGYYVYHAADNYFMGFKILSRTDTTLVVEDLSGLLRAGQYRWQIKGYRKNEILNLLGYSISWALVTRSHDKYNAGDDGGLSDT